MKTLTSALNASRLKDAVNKGKNVMLDTAKNASSLGYLKQNGAIGSFGIPDSKNADFTIYPLTWSVNADLKSDEVIVLSNTERTRRVGNTKFMVKLNLSKGLVYFLDAKSEDDPIFETKGQSLSYIRFYEPSI